MTGAVESDDVARRVARVLLRPWCRVHAVDVHHVPAAGGVLLAVNHLSHADSIALGLAVRHRRLRFVGDVDLLATPLLGRQLASFGMVGLHRGAADTDALEQLVALLQDGHAVVVYPEGSRSRTGEVHRLRSGVARIAASAGVPVVPVGVSGTARLWPVDRRPRLRGGRVNVRFGSPSSPASNHGVDRRAFTNELQTSLVALAGAPRAEHFAPVGGGT